MKQRILVIDGHPDSSPERLVHALAKAYHDSAVHAGHQVKLLNVAKMEFEWLRSSEDFQHGRAPASIVKAQEQVKWCTHLVVVYPLWLGDMPSLLKAFFEQLLRPGFAFGTAAPRKLPQRLLSGRTARIVVTMGMPGFFYRWYFRAHSLRSLSRNILGATGIRPVRSSIIGSVETKDARKRQRWLQRMRELGRVGR